MNKIIYLFKIIADSSIDNKIALMATLISAGALIASIYFNHKTRKQYINSLNPLLSFELRKNMGSLCLMMINTGQSAAKNINISFKKIQNNGEYDTFDIDNNLKNKLDLYPGEKIIGRIARSGENLENIIAPVIEIDLLYENSNMKKIEKYSRKITCTQEIDDMKDIEEIKDSIREISNRLNEISYSNNRMANYFEGRCLFKFDEINVIPNSSLYDDMKDAFQGMEHNKEIIGRDENGTIN